MSNHDKVTKEGISEDEMDELDVVLAAMRHHATQLGEAFDSSAVACLGSVDVSTEDFRSMVRAATGGPTATNRGDHAAKHPKAQQVLDAHMYNIIAKKTECLERGRRIVAYSYVYCVDMPIGVAVVMDLSGVQQNWFIPK